MAVAWFCLKLLFPRKPKLRVFGLFGCTHKTVAIGVPLINSIYEDDPLVGLYTLPLLVWHPTQLVLGSALAPKLNAWVQKEKERLGIKDEDEAKENEDQGDEGPQQETEKADIEQDLASEKSC